MMDELRWIQCTDPEPLFDYLPNRTTRRKVRLITCAICRRIWDLLLDSRSRTAVEVAERYADDQATREELLQAREGASRAAVAVFDQPGMAATSVAQFLTHFVEDFAVRSAAQQAATARAWAVGDPVHGRSDSAAKAEQTSQSDLVREIIGNPFQPFSIDRSWLTETVQRLALDAYDNRDMPAGTLQANTLLVLSDALEEEGCTDQGILGHLRDSRPHVRGCHVLDLLLGRD